MNKPRRKTVSILLALVALALPLVPATTSIAAVPAAEGSSGPAPEELLKRNQVSAADVGDGEFRKEQERALGGDREAAVKVAQMYKTGSNGVPKDEGRMVDWLVHASKLNSGAASYQLYLHYLDQRLDREAVFFENRALEQGFKPPPRLDPRRG